MLQLPLLERMLFISALTVSLISSVLAILQLTSSGRTIRHLLVPLIAIVVALESAMLINRSFIAYAIPLTSLFESMLFVSVIFGIAFIVLSFTISQLWFRSVMTWVITALVLLGAFVATPHSQLQPAARNIWVAIHALSMALSGTAIAMSGTIAALFLLSRRNLKQKKITSLLGRMPNIEKLQSLNLLGLQVSFLTLTVGLLSGIAIAIIKAKQINITAEQWLTDSKTILVITSWVLLGLLLGLRYLFLLRARMIARMTLIVCFMIIFAIVGTTIFCNTDHDFKDELILPVNKEVQ